MPDPLARSTFQSSVLDRNASLEPAAQKRLALVSELLGVRRREIVPRLAGAAFGEAQVTDNCRLTAHWRMGDGVTLRLLANLSERNAAHAPGEFKGALIWGCAPGEIIPPWSVSWRIEP